MKGTLKVTVEYTFNNINSGELGPYDTVKKIIGDEGGFDTTYDIINVLKVEEVKNVN